ncbi:MAG TPA: nuclear transport factor 2 family protein [Bacteroidia bacterium]|nr:nuclear transport factor 2 family protein [Bacteroidia bacterium]
MKIKTTFALIVACAALMLNSCTNPAPKAEMPEQIDMAKLKVEIQALEDAFATAEKAKDADGVAAYYSDDAVSYSRNKEPQVGKEAIKAYIAKRMAEDTTTTTNVYKVVDLYAAGDMAVEIGSWQELNAAGEESGRGHYMSYFEKRNGKYVCVRDMNVSSMPETPAK